MYRWLRKWALALGWRWEPLAFLLPWLPRTRSTELLAKGLTDLAYARGARREFGDDQWTALTEGTIVLCYHKFSLPGGERSAFVIPIDQFLRQIKVLESAGYRFITIRAWIDAWKRREVIGGRTAIVTIDDGTSDLADIAEPELRRTGIRPALYVVRDWIGKPGYLSADQIDTLAKDGCEIGSHSQSHQRLTRLTEDQQRREIIDGRSELAAATGVRPETFAYPYGDCDAASQRLVREAGFAAALGVERGYAYLHSSPWNLPRFVVDGRWPIWRFKLVVFSGTRLHGLI
ncbi:MAG TPA: polysaccharide deacetylase family protein [Candidatus Binataceae bacterium]|nr:polysaccharide deacetylase family protein [Candidatus Binataceae bacterium]